MRTRIDQPLSGEDGLDEFLDGLLGMEQNDLGRSRRVRGEDLKRNDITLSSTE